MSKYSDEYLNYLHSDKWKEQRAKAFAHDGNMCAICGSTEHLEGHHIRYGLMGTEQDWLEVLTVCHDCHEKLEDIKAEARQAKREAERKSMAQIIDEKTAAVVSLVMIAALIKRPECYPYISHVFSLEDFPESDPFYREAAAYVIGCLNRGEEPLLADLISRFDKAEDQQRISKIAGCRLPEDHSDLSKFFTQTLRILKELKMEELIRKADAEAVMRAVRIQKELGRLEIRID